VLKNVREQRRIENHLLWGETNGKLGLKSHLTIDQLKQYLEDKEILNYRNNWMC